MKTKLLVALILPLLLTTGCLGPYYKSSERYKKGEWSGRTKYQEAYKDELHHLNIAKLKETPVRTAISSNGVFLGNYGFIVNLSTIRRLRFEYYSPQSGDGGADFLGPGQQLEKPLLPGKYYGDVFHRGRKVGSATFESEPVEKTFLGKKGHWFFYSE